MEKLGIANVDLLVELKQSYLELRQKEAQLIKEGHGGQCAYRKEIEAVKAKIDEMEANGGGSTT